MNGRVTTEIGDNWSVFFFECPAHLINGVLVDLFQFLKRIQKAEIPHFMVREFKITRSFGISLRILRSPDNAEIVDAKLAELFKKKKLQYQANPEGSRHAWIRKGARSAHWDRNRCEALHQLSNFAVLLAKSNIFSTQDRCYFAHYAVNMFGLQEATIHNSNQVCYLDVITGQALSFHTQQLPSV